MAANRYGDRARLFWDDGLEGFCDTAQEAGRQRYGTGSADAAKNWIASHNLSVTKAASHQKTEVTAEGRSELRPFCLQ
jgi:hypothetical protein